MKKIKKWLMFAVLAMTICLIANCNLYGQEVQINERLSDGSLIITVEGKKYRAITTEQIRQIQEMKVGYESVLQENTVLKAQNKSLREAFTTVQTDLSVANLQIENERRRGEEYKKLYEDERALRSKAEQLPKKKNTLEKILNHPVTQIITVAIAGVIAAKQ